MYSTSQRNDTDMAPKKLDILLKDTFGVVFCEKHPAAGNLPFLGCAVLRCSLCGRAQNWDTATGNWQMKGTYSRVHRSKQRTS